MSGVIAMLAILGILGVAYVSTGKALQSLSIQLRGVDIRQGKLFLLLNIQNVSNVDIRINFVSLKVFWKGNQIGQVLSDDQIYIPAKGVSYAAFPVQINLLSVAQTLFSALRNKEKIVLDVKGYITTTAGKYEVNQKLRVNAKVES